MLGESLVAVFSFLALASSCHGSGSTTVPTTTKRPLLPSQKPTEETIPVKLIIPPEYRKGNRPTPGKPTEVLFDIHVVAINPIKAADMDFRMDMTLSQRWIDHRLNFSEEFFQNERDYFILPVEFTDQIWHPDPYIVNAKSTDVGQLTQKLVTVNIYRNHTVHYTTNLFATVACAMNYRYYPFDHQVCPMYIESFSFDETQVKYQWAREDAFTINPKLRMLQFVVSRPLHYHEASVPRYLEVKNFSQLIACFRFDRLLGNHLIQTFSPCSLIVCLSWFSFWMELNALSARMSLVVTSILTLVTQFVGLKSDLPPVAYIKAVDIWMAGCLTWVFGALGEYILVKVIYSLTEDAKFHYDENNRNETYKASDTIPEKAELTTGNQLPSLTTRRRQLIRPTSSISSLIDRNEDELDRFRRSVPNLNSVLLEKSFGKLRVPLQWTSLHTGETILLWKRIDGVCKWLFPASFCIFCGVYWTILYIHSEATAVQPFSPKLNLNSTVCRP